MLRQWLLNKNIVGFGPFEQTTKTDFRARTVLKEKTPATMPECNLLFLEKRTSPNAFQASACFNSHPPVVKPGKIKNWILYLLDITSLLNVLTKANTQKLKHEFYSFTEHH